MVKNYDVITIISKYLLRKPGVDNFADIIKIVTAFIKKNFKDSKKIKKIEIMYQNPIYIFIF